MLLRRRPCRLHAERNWRTRRRHAYPHARGNHARAFAKRYPGDAGAGAETQSALVDDAPLVLKEGGIFRTCLTPT